MSFCESSVLSKVVNGYIGEDWDIPDLVLFEGPKYEHVTTSKIGTCEKDDLGDPEELSIFLENVWTWPYYCEKPFEKSLGIKPMNKDKKLIIRIENKIRDRAALKKLDKSRLFFKDTLYPKLFSDKGKLLTRFYDTKMNRLHDPLKHDHKYLLSVFLKFSAITSRSTIWVNMIRCIIHKDIDINYIPRLLTYPIVRDIKEFRVRIPIDENITGIKRYGEYFINLEDHMREVEEAYTILCQKMRNDGVNPPDDGFREELKNETVVKLEPDWYLKNGRLAKSKGITEIELGAAYYIKEDKGVIKFWLKDCCKDW